MSPCGPMGCMPKDEENDHVHQWQEAYLKNHPGHDFWICIGCGKTSPGPTDNEDLYPWRLDK